MPAKASGLMPAKAGGADAWALLERGHATFKSWVSLLSLLNFQIF
jgi:hypothetical protein